MTTSPAVRPESSASAPEPELRRTSETVRRTALFAGVLFSGLFAGFLTGVLILEASLRGYPASVYTQVRLVELAHLDDLATALLPAAILATATLVVVTMARRERGAWPALVALGLLLAAFLISLLVSVPINTGQQSWSVLAPPADWVGVRDHWQIAHLLRTTCAVVAFAVLAAASTVARKRRRTTSYPAAT